MKKIFLLLFVITLQISCSEPQTKGEYLKQYADFINNVEHEYKDYSSDDWKKADAKFEKFAGDLKDKFKNELSFTEKALLLSYEVKYNLYRYANDE